MWCLCLGIGTCGSTFRSQSHLQGANFDDFTGMGGWGWEICTPLMEDFLFSILSFFLGGKSSSFN